MGKGRIGGFILHAAILFVLFISFIDQVYRLSGKIFWLEIVAVVGLLLMAVFSLGGYLTKAKRGGLIFIYFVSLLNVIALGMLNENFSMVALILAIAGLLFSKFTGGEDDDWKPEDVKVEEITPEPSMVEEKKVTRKPAKKKAKKKRRKK